MPRKSNKKAMKGYGLMDTLKGLHSKIKEGKYISRGLKMLGTAGNIPIVGSYIAPYQGALLKAGNVASEMGYGKKKRRVLMK